MVLWVGMPVTYEMQTHVKEFLDLRVLLFAIRIEPAPSTFICIVGASDTRNSDLVFDQACEQLASDFGLDFPNLSVFLKMGQHLGCK